MKTEAGFIWQQTSHNSMSVGIIPSFGAPPRNLLGTLQELPMGFIAVSAAVPEKESYICLNCSRFHVL